MSEPMSREQFIEILEDTDDVLQPGQFSRHAKQLLAHDAALRAENERLLRVAQRQIKESGEKLTQYEQDTLDLTAQLAASEARNDELQAENADLRAMGERLLAKLSEGKVMVDDIKITGEL